MNKTIPTTMTPENIAILAAEIRSSVTGLAGLEADGYPVTDDKFIVNWLFDIAPDVFYQVVADAGL